MTNNIKAFMPDKKKTEEVFEYVQTQVFDEPVKIRLLKQKEAESIMNACTIKDRRGKPQGFDQNKYIKMIAVRSMVEPPLDAQELQDAYEVMGDMDAFDKIFDKHRDAQQIINAANELNSSEELDDLIEEAKN